MADNPIDAHVTRRLRRRRRLLGLTQAQVADSINLGVDAYRKHELGRRIGADRLYSLCLALNVPAGYFYEGLANGSKPAQPANDIDAADLATEPEVLDLVRSYHELDEPRRLRLMGFAHELLGEQEKAT